MGELLCAIEENRRPWNNAKDNLESLQLCFAACASADKGGAVDPHNVGWKSRKPNNYISRF